MRTLLIAAWLLALSAAADAETPTREWGGVELYEPAPGTYAFEQMRSAAKLTVPCVIDAVRLSLRSQKQIPTDRSGAYQAAWRLCSTPYISTLTRLGAPSPVPQAFAAIGQQVDFDFDLLGAGLLRP
jgi:hypothetical protein